MKSSNAPKTAMPAESTCCTDSREDQLYMLELLVDHLNLTAEKLREIGSSSLSVRLEFLDFPTFEINEEDFCSSKKRKDKSRDGSLDFSAGKSCLFPKKPSELVRAMRSKPLTLGIYKSAEKKPCEKIENEIPFCKTQVPLSGCLCDQVAMASNDSAHLPKPYTLRNTWNLVDEEAKPSGTISLFIKLTCLGKSVVTQFAVQEKTFLFKSSNSPNEFQCSRVEDEFAKKGEEEMHEICERESRKDAPRPRSVIGLGNVCEELTKRDGGALEIVPPIRLFTQRCVEEKITEKNTLFEKKFTNSRCNDHSGDFGRRAASNFSCWSCSGGLCTGTRTIDPSTQNRRYGMLTSPFQRENCCSDVRANYRYRPRMRGGGRWDEDKDTLGACKSSLKNQTNSTKPGCGCFGKLGTGMMGANSAGATKSGGASTKNPCLGVDCLIRAFKETQEFVDSIGKVPGLAGLGLMDPAESPFFGRERNDAPTSCAPQIAASPFSTTVKASTLQPLAKNGQSRAPNAIPPATSGLVTSAHPNVHQTEGQSAISGSHSPRTASKKKSDERAEKPRDSQDSAEGDSGPCAEPRCKSRKKKAPEETSNGTSKSNLPRSENKVSPDVTTRMKTWRIGRTRSHGRRKLSPDPVGPAGDGSSFSRTKRTSHIRVSKKIMRLVNAARDPRFSHGHKNCHDVRIRVPGNMGWLWNSNEVPGRLKTPIGWKPGAISKFVWDRLQAARVMTAGTISTGESRPATPSKGKRGKSLRIKSFHSLGRIGQWARSRMIDPDDEEIELPPTLHVHRKDGTYYVTMYPVKAENLNNPESREAAKPLQFKITKNREDGSVGSSSTGSDMEIEFSPPAAIDRYTKREPGKDGVTQVSQQEILEATRVIGEKRTSRSKRNKMKK